MGLAFLLNRWFIGVLTTLKTWGLFVCGTLHLSPPWASFELRLSVATHLCTLAGSVGLGFRKLCLCTNIFSVSVLRGPFWFSSSGTFSAGNREESQGAAGAGEKNGWGGGPESPAARGSQAAGGRAAEGGVGQTTKRTGNWAAYILTNPRLHLFCLSVPCLVPEGSKAASKDALKMRSHTNQGWWQSWQVNEAEDVYIMIHGSPKFIP